MAKRKKAQPWDAVFDRVRCVWRSDKVYSPKTAATELDLVEVELGFKFPVSYRVFAEQFGLGGELEVAPLVGIKVTVLPLSGPPNRESGNWASVIDRTLGVRKEFRSPNLPLLYRRSSPRPSSTTSGRSELPRGSRPTTEFAELVAFAGDDDEGLGTFLFQPSEVTDAKQHECRIFVINNVRSLRPVADSFWEWLGRID